MYAHLGLEDEEDDVGERVERHEDGHLDAAAEAQSTARDCVALGNQYQHEQKHQQ